jgi:hypothetical protein
MFYSRNREALASAANKPLLKGAIIITEDSAMVKRFVCFVVVFALAASFVSCSKGGGGSGSNNPIGPSGPQPITISPADFTLNPGGTRTITASGGGGTFTYNLPDGGGEIQMSGISSNVTLKAGMDPGRYRVVVNSPGVPSETATFEVISEEFALKLVWKELESGSTVSGGKAPLFRIVYSTTKSASTLVRFQNAQGEFVPASGNGRVVNGSGTLEVSGKVQNVPQTTEYVVIEMRDANGSALFASLKEAIQYHWK